LAQTQQLEERRQECYITFVTSKTWSHTKNPWVPRVKPEATPPRVKPEATPPRTPGCLSHTKTLV
jgi:hypothetical protein